MRGAPDGNVRFGNRLLQARQRKARDQLSNQKTYYSLKQAETVSTPRDGTMSRRIIGTSTKDNSRAA